MGFLELLGEAIILGIAAAFTPSLLALQVLVVSGDPWRRRALAVVAGNALAFGIVGALLFLGFAQLPQKSASHGAVDDWVRIGAGVLLVIVAIVLFRPHPRLRSRVSSDIEGYVSHASTWVFLGVAFALSIKDVSSFVVMAPLLHDVAVSELNIPEQAILIGVLYALALSPVLVPPAVRLLFGHRADVVLRRISAYTMSHEFQLIGGMAAVIGVYLVATGIARLV